MKDESEYLLCYIISEFSELLNCYLVEVNFKMSLFNEQLYIYLSVKFAELARIQTNINRNREQKLIL